MKYCIILLSFFFTTLSNASEMPRNDLAGPENINDLKVQIQWINPTAIRAYLNDTKTLLGEKSPALYEKLSRLGNASARSTTSTFRQCFRRGN